MARASRVPELGLEAITIEGGLIAPEQVARIAATERNDRTAADYDSPKGVRLGDEIARYFRIGQAIWRDYDRVAQPTVTQTAQFARDLLAGAFGFTDLAGPAEHRDGSRRYRIAWEAKGGRVPVVVAAPLPDGDGFTKALPEFGDGEGGRPRRSPIVLMQDWLNHTDAALWGLVFAGDRVRLMRDNASLTRAAWIEADLGSIFRDDMFADFTAWWLLTHASRFGAASTPASAAPLERWREEGLKQGTAARERLREGVEEALRELGQGLVDANPIIRDRVAVDPAATTALFEELLRTVYRLIFLAVAEDRDLLHPRTTGQKVRDLYAANYSFGFWRDRSARRAAHDAHHDAWEGMKITLAALEQGQPALGLPALGGLFARGATPMLNAARIPNRRFLTAIHCLGFITVNSALTRINWRAMRTEELGSVYESLLEIRPRLLPDGTFDLDSGAKGNARKTSGSYYTPDSLVETLLDSALDPVLAQAEANGGADAILDLKVIDPACGSGHFLLGAVRRMADKVAQARNPDAPDTQAALRDVVSRSIHGVDRNPMAVELAKVALWIESVSPGQPLGFLDANIRCGDALLGVFSLDALEEGVPDEAYKPLTGDDKAAARYYGQQNKAAKKGQGQFDWSGGGGAMPPRRLASNLSTIRRMPEDTVGQVEKKRAAFEAWRNDPARYATRVACDLYTAAFLLPKTEVPLNGGRNMVPTTADVRTRLAGGQVYGPLEAAAVDAAATARALHWPLAFPDVMVERGGFDVVLGNPPYLSALEQARMGIDREREYWRFSKRSAQGSFDLYVLFLELGLALSPKGRCSLLTPNKYLSAPYGEALRNLIKDRGALASIVDESAGDHFPDASVYPVITNFSSNDAKERSEVQSIRPTAVGRVVTSHRAADLYGLPNANLGPLLSSHAPLLYRVLRQTVPLATLCEVKASTTASEADEFTDALADDEFASETTTCRVINTGLIDPFRVKWGQQPLRHAKRSYQYPMIDLSNPVIPERRRVHYASAKLIFAKLASSPEIYVDELGHYAALNVNFAFCQGDAAFFIAAQLNSVVGEWLYRQLFGALAMSGGFLQYQAPQIRSWPVQPFDHRNQLHLEVVNSARRYQAGNCSVMPVMNIAKCFGLSESDLEVIINSLSKPLDGSPDEDGAA